MGVEWVAVDTVPTDGRLAVACWRDNLLLRSSGFSRWVVDLWGELI
jgi:hypothetical protein